MFTKNPLAKITISLRRSNRISSRNAKPQSSFEIGETWKRAQSDEDNNEVQTTKLKNTPAKFLSIRSGSFVAVNCPKTSENDPFWVGKVIGRNENLLKKNKSLEVVWLCPEQNNVSWTYSSYSASTFLESKEKDTIPVASVLWTFAELTLNGKIPQKEISCIKEALVEE